MLEADSGGSCLAVPAPPNTPRTVMCVVFMASTAVSLEGMKILGFFVVKFAVMWWSKVEKHIDLTIYREGVVKCEQSVAGQQAGGGSSFWRIGEGSTIPPPKKINKFWCLKFQSFCIGNCQARFS